jgi:hypothetical protein
MDQRCERACAIRRKIDRLRVGRISTASHFDVTTALGHNISAALRDDVPASLGNDITTALSYDVPAP